MGFGKKDGEYFDDIEVALVPIVEHHVTNEFVVGGLSDHAAKPTGIELHAEVTSNEVVRVTPRARARRRRERRGEIRSHRSQSERMRRQCGGWGE